MAELLVPIEAYQRRAANVPSDWRDEFDRLIRELFDHSSDEARLLSAPELASPRVTWADISYYQRVVNSEYPYQVLAHRADHGRGIDTNARANWAYTEKHLAFGFGYIVWMPGQNAAIMRRLKDAYGSKAPANFCPMIDMESGKGFAGPGNHSTEVNQFAEMLVNWCDGNEKRVVGYANAYDWANNWPTRPHWLKRITASYGTKNPGTWGWQYYGGLNYPIPAGFVNSCRPFGTHVDLNSYSGSLAQMKQDLGLGLEFEDMTPAQIQDAILDALETPRGQVALGNAVLNRKYRVKKANNLPPTSTDTVTTLAGFVVGGWRFTRGAYYGATARKVGEVGVSFEEPNDDLEFESVDDEVTSVSE